MLDLSNLAPKLAFWNLLLFFGYLLFKYYGVPRIIQWAVENAPLEAPDAQLNEFQLLSLDDVGFKMYIDSTVAGSKLPSLRLPNLKLNSFWIRIRLGQITIKDLASDQLMGILNISNPIVVTTARDVALVQTIRFDFCENASALKNIVKRVSIVGPNELRLVSIRVSFRLSISILDLFVLEDIECGKTINLGELREVMKKSASSVVTTPVATTTLPPPPLEEKIQRESLDGGASITESEMTAVEDSSFETESSDGVDDQQDLDQVLFPDPLISVFASPKGMRVEAGLDIEFSRPPKFNFDVGTIRFTLMLHSSTFAKVVINGLCLSPDSCKARLVVEVLPSALSNKPITGAVTTIRGALKGVLKGALNGIMNGDWGGQIAILGVKKIEILNGKGRNVWWIEELLEDIEFEHDVDAVRRVKTRVGKKGKNLQSALGRMWRAALFPTSSSSS